jgi:hypothetical protein
MGKLKTPVVARVPLQVAPKGEEPFTVTVEIGTPYMRETGEWACPLALEGLYETLLDARGEDSLQALCLAISLALDLLDDIRRKGGRLLWDEDEFQLEAYAFGAAVRPSLPNLS